MEQKVKVEVEARRDSLDKFFRYCVHGGEDGDDPHHQYLVLRVQRYKVKGTVVTVTPYSVLESVLGLPDNVQVMKQWPGQWRSDWFRFTVGELRAYCKEANQ
jgi:hypothetical protein